MVEALDAPDLPELDLSAGPLPLRWTRDEYDRLADEGWFEGRRVEFIDGEIIEMPAQKGPHVVTVDVAGEALKAGFGPGHFVRRQAPLNLPNGSAPESDLAVVEGEARQHLVNPSFALLVAEVSDRTLAYDLGRKAILYARGGIPEYWVIDLTKRRLIVHRQPDPANGTWCERIEIADDGTVSPSAKPELVIRVADLLP